ncbi:hypothetical protein BH11MYX4_BH11MYX4_38140 [soil metagenome]
MKNTSFTLSLSAAALVLTMAVPSIAEARVVRWGENGDVPITADFDGDGRADITVWRPTTGEWWTIRRSTGATTRTVWGQQGDVPVAADYDGDGKADIAVFRASVHTWWFILSADSSVKTAQWGDPGDIAVPADYDGDGKADVAIWRPSTGVWWLAQSRDGIRTKQWGTSGDVPLTGSYDGWLGADFAVWRPSTREVFTFGSSPWGTSGSQRLPSFNDVPVAASFWCYGSTIASWNKVTGVWTVPSQSVVQYGIPGDVPVPANYNGDANGSSLGAQRAVFRPSEGKWYIHEVQQVCLN